MTGCGRGQNSQVSGDQGRTGPLLSIMPLHSVMSLSPSSLLPSSSCFLLYLIPFLFSPFSSLSSLFFSVPFLMFFAFTLNVQMRCF